MPEFQPTFDQAYAYYAYRLPMQRLAKAKQVNARCPFHDDHTSSMSINFDQGTWNCHACAKGGGILDFERATFPAKALEEIWQEIYRITGIDAPRVARKLIATYSYEDVGGRLLYEKLRFEPKDFRQRQPDGKGGWRYNLEGVKKVLYHLPKVVTARTVIICEGEKDADNLQQAVAVLPPEIGAVVTTNFDGAGKWRPEYSPYLAGKYVLILPDNDAIGKRHAEAVATSVAPYAEKIKVIELPGLAEHGDVSDWLSAGHTAHELWKLVRTAPTWEPKPVDHLLLEEMQQFLDRTPAEIEWLVDGVLPKGANGLLLAYPKVGKSLAAIDLALALVSASSWLGFVVSRRRRVALISREDSPDETGRRIKSFMEGNPARADYHPGQMWINTRLQSSTLLLDNHEEMDQLIREMKMESMDLAIFDVFRRLHNADENDNTQMAAVLASLTRVQAETGAAIALVHHVTKEGQDNIFRAARGAGAIHGWMEWGIGLTVCDESQPRSAWVRRAEFETKCALPPDPRFYKVTTEGNGMHLEVTDAVTIKKAKGRSVTEIVSGKSFYDRED